jgi:hypothetical protein
MNLEVKEKEIIKTVIAKEKVIVLTLSEEEAFYIKALVGRVGGNCKLRDFAGILYYKLDSIVPRTTHNVLKTVVIPPNEEFRY